MSELKRISPLLDDFDVGGSISEHTGVFCHPAMRRDTDERYIIKTVSIPASQTQLDALLLTGAFPDTASALNYFKDQADRTVEELELLQNLSHQEGFLSYDNWQIDVKTDGIGFDVYMIGTYKRTLQKFMKKQPMTHLGAINLGLDICTALEVCRRQGYLYVDLKPSNIYVVDDQQFRIGDLGFIALDSLSYASLPDKYRSDYTPPELQDPFATLNATVDVYALGLMLHQIYNGNELPVRDENGIMAAPVNADYEMAEIILKACDPEPSKRWQNPVEMGQALVSYMQRNGANDTPIVPPVVEEVYIPVITDDIDLSDIDLSDAPDMLVEADTAIDLSEIPVDPETEDAPDDMDIEESAKNLELIAPAEDTDALEEVALSDPELKTDTPPEADAVDVTVFENLSFIDESIEDETAPENNISDVAYESVSDELVEILAQADELVSHPVPEPVVAPAPVDIQSLEIAEVLNSNADAVAIEAEDQVSQDTATSQQAASMAETVIVPNTSSDAEPEILEDEPEQLQSELQPKKKKSALQIVLNIVIIVLCVAVLAMGLLYYKNVYLLPIDELTVTGDENSMSVKLSSNIDESLLSVVCSDSHGNQISAPVVNGTATFSNLSPDTAYTLQILVDGFHRLTGETAASYSTPAQTNVVQFNAVTGTEDGSVILGFTVEGPDNGTWSVAYSAPGEEEKTVELLSHMATLTGLTVGKEYTFRLIPDSSMYVTGQTELSFTASNLIYAQNVSIISCVDNQLTVTWDAPETGAITEWAVRCYDDADYNQTFITVDTSAVFENIDPSKNYTVEVTAAGMSVSERAFMAANAITISNFAVDPGSNKMTLTWDSSREVPEDGWVLLYTVDGCPIQSSLTCSENRAVISPIIPDANYVFTLQLTNGDAVLTTPMTYQTAKAKDFSGYGMIRSSMTFKLCKRPGDSNWEYSDLSDSAYTNEFATDEKLSMVGQLHDTYGISDDKIITMYVFRDAANNVATFSYTESPWDEMWHKYYGEFDIPQAPDKPGEYTLSIYFNGKLVVNKKVTITEPEG